MELSSLTSDSASRERFIPYSRKELIRRCIADGRLSDEDAQRFRLFCELLAAYYHFQFHHLLEQLKDSYRPFEQDAHVRHEVPETSDALGQAEARMLDTLDQVLRRANYTYLDEISMRQALDANSALLDLESTVELNDFDKVCVYYLGKKTATLETKQYFWKKKQVVELFTRVVLLLKFKDQTHFEEQGKKLKKLSFKPGQIYLYLYHNIPRNDLELLFPNVKLGMNRLDKILFIVPTIGAGVSLAVNTFSKLLLILGVVLFFSMGPSASELLDVREDDVNDIMPTLTAMLTVLVALGGFAWSQFAKYRNKRIQFLKNVTETLFFRNLGSSASVLHNVIDSAEEEETKEAILVYYHLLLNNDQLTPEQLDREIEHWMQNHLDTKVDFDIEQTLAQLHALEAEICHEGEKQRCSLVTVNGNGHCRALPLPLAKQVLDTLWDNAYQYA